jgi:hypothetical protein
MKKKVIWARLLGWDVKTDDTYVRLDEGVNARQDEQETCGSKSDIFFGQIRKISQGVSGRPVKLTLGGGTAGYCFKFSKC